MFTIDQDTLKYLKGLVASAKEELVRAQKKYEGVRLAYDSIVQSQSAPSENNIPLTEQPIGPLLKNCPKDKVLFQGFVAPDVASLLMKGDVLPGNQPADKKD